MPRPSRREDVLHAASRRFFRNGITATGVDRVIADAGVAKMTLYGNFGSKDELVLAYLEDRDRRFFQQLEEEIAAADTPIRQAMAPVRLYRRHLDEEGFRGCAFINAAAELPEDHPGRAVILAHKQRTLELWERLVAKLDVDEPETATRECFLMLEGAFVQAGLSGQRELFDLAEERVRRRLTDGTPSPRRRRAPSQRRRNRRR